MKNQPTRKLRVIASCGVLFALTQSVPIEWKLSEMMQPKALAEVPSYDPQESAARLERAWQLYRVWQNRSQRDVTPQVVPFLQDKDASIRNSTVRVLARLETPQAERVLDELARTNAQIGDQRNKFPPLTLRLALGRIHSRKLKGQKRLDAFAKGVDLSFNEIVAFSQKVNAPKAYAYGTPENEIFQETIDLLSMMGRRGENIEPFIKQFTLTPAQQVQLQSASMPLKRAVPFILEYISSRKVIDDYGLTRYLADLGPQATTMILRYLSQMPKEASGGRQPRGYKLVFRAAGLTGEARAADLIRPFEASPDMVIAQGANDARLSAEQKGYYPPLP